MSRNQSKQPNKEKNRRILPLVIAGVLVLLLIAAPVTYAIFTNSMHAQRTIAAYNVSGNKFSSNYLMPVSNPASNVRTVFVTSNTQRPTAVVTVCNYDQGMQTKPNANNIAYDISMRLVRKDGGSYVPVDAAYLSANDLTGATITVSDATNTVTLGGSTLSDSTTFSGTLPGGAARSDAFRVQFSTDFGVENPLNLALEMTATPTGGASDPIRGIITAGLRTEGAVNQWQGSFFDSTASTPAEYDGYNYVIEGSGSGTFTLKWDNSKLTVSDESVRELGITVTTSGTLSSFTINVDSDVTPRYELQFYRKNIAAATAWSHMNAELATAEDALSTSVVGYYFHE